MNHKETRDMTFYLGKRVELSILIELLEMALANDVDCLPIRKEDAPMFLMEEALAEGFPLLLSINWKKNFTPRLDNTDLAKLMAEKLETRVVTFLPDRLNPTQNPQWYLVANEDGSLWKMKEDLTLRNRDGLFLDVGTKTSL